MVPRFHRWLLHVYRHLPVRMRRRVVRLLAPTFTVGAICVIERADGAILLVRQTYRRRWGTPGGLLMRGEKTDDAVRREVKEEIGVDIELVGEPAVVVDPVPRRVDVIFRGRLAETGDFVHIRPCSPEIDEARWFRPGALPEVQHETAAALRALDRASGESGSRPRLRAAEPPRGSA
jgi:8-oxo-dGTP diphosphatase